MDNDLQGMILAKLTSIEHTITETAVTVARLDERVTNATNESGDHESRIRSLEHWKWGFTGVLALLTSVAAIYTQVKGA